MRAARFWSRCNLSRKVLPQLPRCNSQSVIGQDRVLMVNPVSLRMNKGCKIQRFGFSN